MSQGDGLSDSLPRPIRTSVLLEELGSADPADLHLEDVLRSFQHRAFGVLLLLVTLPIFLPIPVGIGALVGPLVTLVGLQMLAGFSAPWLPVRFRRHKVDPGSIQNFMRRFGNWVRRVERLCTPRWKLLQSAVGLRVAGAILALLGVAVALPIPLTNYPFGLVLVLFAFALVERDGLVLTVATAIGAAVIAAMWFLGDALVGWAAGLF